MRFPVVVPKKQIRKDAEAWGLTHASRIIALTEEMNHTTMSAHDRDLMTGAVKEAAGLLYDEGRKLTFENLVIHWHLYLETFRRGSR